MRGIRLSHVTGSDLHATLTPIPAEGNYIICIYIIVLIGIYVPII